MTRRAARGCGRGAVALVGLLAASCATSPAERASYRDYYGTLEPFASEAVYFVMTDRFVDGDPGNNQRQQGAGDPALRTFDRPIVNGDGQRGNIGYLGGDFRGLLDNAGYIAEMGFTAVWLTPIVENPDEAFTGGNAVGEGLFADLGKAGYHGYWGVNFFEEDEHLISDGLAFADLTREMAARHGLKTVLDVVCNHGSPSYTMPEDQPMFGEIYDADGTLIADHQNLPPAELDPDGNPLHAFFHTEPDLAELSNLDDTNPAVLDYFVRAYLKWIGQGAAAFRIDTIGHMPNAFWKAFSDGIRTEHPEFFLFGEHFSYDAAEIASHTFERNGRISVLDFPGREAITKTFGREGAPFGRLLDYLHLRDGVYRNPYELMTFYDNHDTPRMDASENGFIDAHNWLFTSRGIPVVYQGSEIAFRAGRPEHGGNRDYFGQDNIERARQHRIRAALRAIAGVRRASPALQRGLQANLRFDENTAAFMRVYQKGGVNQSALVLLNKGDAAARFEIDQWLSPGPWRDALSGEVFAVGTAAPRIATDVAAHGVRVLLYDGPVTEPRLARELDRLQTGVRR